MGSHEAINVLLAKIKNLDPENASKVMGYLLMNLEDTELLRLACTPDHVLHALVLRMKTHLGLSSNTSSSPSTPSSPSPLQPIARPASSNPFSHSSPRIATNGFDFSGNSSWLSSHAWALSAFPNNPISPKSSPLLSYENISSGSVSSPSFSPRMNGDFNAISDFDEHQLNDYFSFLNESSKNEDSVDPRLGVHNWHSVNHGDEHFHRRSYSASEVCFGSEEAGSGIGYKPCVYFSRGFCKNGSDCNFVHSALTDSLDATSGAIVGSPSKFEGFEQREELIRLKLAQHQRLLAASQLRAGASPSSYDKYINFLMQQQNDPQRAAAAAAFMKGDEISKFGRCGSERSDFLAMMSAEKPNSASRQIYLTFPAESTFKDEDVSEYFSKFGPVQDVRIPYQQKRMFGFVTFVYPETVRLILSKGNPHFICDSRVLVKPYKEKGKIPDKRQQHQQQQSDRGDFSPCLSLSGFDSKESYDSHLGARMLYNPHGILLRRKLQDHTQLQQAIELQERRLMNLHLPDFKNNHIHNLQRSLSVGASLPLPQQKGDITGFCGNLESNISLADAAEEFDPACIHDTDNGSGSKKEETIDLHNSMERALPDSLFALPSKAAGDNLSEFCTLAEESAVFSTTSSSHCKAEPTTLSDMASH